MNYTKIDPRIEEEFNNKMPNCSCGSGRNVVYIDMPAKAGATECKYYAALKNKKSAERLFCTDCSSEERHNHFP